MKLRRRAFFSIFITSFIVLLLSVTVVTAVLYHEFAAERRAEIAVETGYIAEAYDPGDLTVLRRIGTESVNRITVVSSDGTVLYDSFADAASLPNHADRPEIAQALASGTGESTRDSETLGELTYYYAARLSDGCVLRVAATMRSISHLLDGTIFFLLLIVLISLGISALAAYWFTKRLLAPVNAIDLDNPLESPAYAELSPLMVRMDRQNHRISEQMKQLSLRQREFTEITDGMDEALAVFGADRRVLMLNRSARRLFDCPADTETGYLELCRDLSYIKVMDTAFAGHAGGEKLAKNGRTYRIWADPVMGDGRFAAVLFAVDITDAEQAEERRREFTANVSHELKTPLTSILGYAEIMENGVAKSEDIPRFSARIRAQAGRLLALIEDIIGLSELDEGALRDSFAPVDLYQTASRAVSDLAEKAKEKEITVSLDGEKAVVSGAEPTLYEMIRNLCDNAIVYNHPGGRVDVTVTGGKNPSVTVSDNGIGIAKEEQERIFERFYRVDKGRSREQGGTGLGLSIVKHAAALHAAQISLESAPGRGTRIRITFPETQTK